ncbi:saccharopine dehydrogenase NADP-binding domain-containing protein [Lysobacter sp. BMK333-48F3]|uniref:saccharopine dehydrogenase NADP-binding domain-containing protein n=1 Tax=Lysobacter sp. BMK333-48F3 TaxID=2867962 RepID=UPI001C8C2101|nr:saccharopine dehydrogenase NADP-binding domain-containing protein [Lysobacter sp. BMK333-48F3]MBX9400523.1 saccharopine dehydrogenase NADP-binding domain-containing protein [Lysobacter sp. BMK333-48F3]
MSAATIQGQRTGAADPAAPVAVYGAYGHTGRFVVAELLRRGWTPRLCGRDGAQLQALRTDFPDLEIAVAATDDAAALDRALAGAQAVIHCAGPFLDTGAPVLDAALRAGIGYFDVCAEQAAVAAAYRRHDEAIAAGIVAVPAAAFYGGLADLLASAACADWSEADAIEIAVALDSWQPTLGTRLTGQRNQVPRWVIEDGREALVPTPPPQRDWRFQAPFGAQPMTLLPLSEVVTVSRHLSCRRLHSYMNLAPLQDLRDQATPPPRPADASGRSAQRFAVEVLVRRGGEERRACAQGRDIYAISAPLVVETMERALRGAGRGVIAPAQAGDAGAMLSALAIADPDFVVAVEAAARSEAGAEA